MMDRVSQTTGAGAPPGATVAPEGREVLRAWLRGRDVPCPVCRYNLRDLETDRCPECAAPLRLEVGSPNLEVAPWFIAAVSLSLAIGFDVVVSLLALVSVLIFPATPAIVRDTLIFGGSLLVAGGACAVLLVMLFIRRGAWSRLPSRVQWKLAVGLFLVTGASHLLLGVWLIRFF